MKLARLIELLEDYENNYKGYFRRFIWERAEIAALKKFVDTYPSRVEKPDTREISLADFELFSKIEITKEYLNSGAASAAIFKAMAVDDGFREEIKAQFEHIQLKIPPFVPIMPQVLLPTNEFVDSPEVNAIVSSMSSKGPTLPPLLPQSPYYRSNKPITVFDKNTQIPPHQFDHNKLSRIEMDMKEDDSSPPVLFHF